LEKFSRIEDLDVQLVSYASRPYELAVASARTCYSGKGIIYPEDVSKDERSVEMRDRIASSTMLAGHLTTRQHAHFVFALSGVSRQCIWSFLHAHPFYNSEQVSQRYVRVRRGNFILPALPPSEETLFAETIDSQMKAYERLIELLKAPLAKDYYERFRARAKDPEKWGKAIDKRAFEVARYVLGVGTTAYLYHTISALTLLRYAKLVQLFETPIEQKVLVAKMLESVLAVDPLFEKELADPIPLESTLEYQYFSPLNEKKPKDAKKFAAEFDAELDGKVSKLIDYSGNAEAVIAQATRTALGKRKSDLSDEEAIALVLDPKSNPILADTLNTASLDRLSQILHHVHFAFQKKISHTADSQDQRHRTVSSSRPVLFAHYFGEPDYIIPFGVTQVPEAMELYSQSMEQTFGAINRLLSAGVSEEKAFYLLPNAYSIRMISSGDLHSLQHKWKLRSCYNAQEEIFRAAIDEVQQVLEKFPSLAAHLKAPCYVRLRAGTKPYCPEGDKFCGLPVWKYSIDQYERKSL
jgi:thymidylate synthase ThyX